MKHSKAYSDKVATVMREYKAGTLHAGKKRKGKKQPKATSRKQAIAIALSEASKVEALKKMGGK
jgi:hypothetical protein